MNNNNRYTNVLWVDDDNDGALRALGVLIEESGVNLKIFNNYDFAFGFIQREPPHQPWHSYSLLVDIIIPKKKAHGSLDPFPGLSLAATAASKGIERICFLSVIREDQISTRLQELRSSHRSTRFLYQDKLDLLEGEKLNDILRYLIEK